MKMRWLGLIVVGAMGMLLVGGVSLWAQESPSEARGEAVPTIAVDIPPGPLAQALNAVAEAFGLQLAYDAEITQGKQSAGLRGTFNSDESLRRVLADTGLTYRFTGANTVTLDRVAAIDPEEPELPEVTVVGTAERTPITGPTATSSTTATRIDVNPRQVPQAISIASTDLFLEMGARSVAEAAPLLPGVTQDFNVGRSTLTIRGFESADQTLVDGLRPANTGGAQFSFGLSDLALFDRVEVLKGHSSVLYGQGVPGGSINYVAKKPLFERYGLAELSVAQRNYLRGVFDITGPFSESFAYRLVVAAQNEDSHVLNAQDDRRIVTPSLLWKTPTGGSLLLRYEHLEQDFISPSDAVLINNSIVPYQQIDPRQKGSEFSTDSVRLSLNQPLSVQWKLLIDAAYANQDHLQQNLTFRPVGTIDPTISRGNYLRQERTDKGDALRVEVHGDVRLASTRHRVIVGAERYEQDRAIYRTHSADFAPGPLYAPNFGAPLPGPLAPPQRFGTNAKEQGIFVNDYMDFGERWHAMLGVRNGRNKRINTITGATEDDSQATTPSFGLVYDVSPQLSVYATASRSFSPNGGQAADGTFFDPRRGTNKEVGFKGDALDKKLNYNAALFDLVQDQVTTTDPNNPQFSVLTGEVTVKGAEFDVSAELTPRLTLIGALTLLDATITQNNSGLVGNRPSNAPGATGGLRLSYRAGGGLRVGGTLSYVGNRKVSQTDQVNVPGYARLDLDTGWRLTREWTLSAVLENVFDKDYIASARAATQITSGRPRTVSLRATYEFW